MVETHYALPTVNGQVAAEERMFGEDVKDDDLAMLRSQPHGAVHTTHGSDLRVAHREGLQEGGREGEEKWWNKFGIWFMTRDVQVTYMIGVTDDHMINGATKLLCKHLQVQIRMFTRSLQNDCPSFSL